MPRKPVDPNLCKKSHLIFSELQRPRKKSALANRLQVKPRSVKRIDFPISERIDIPGYEPPRTLGTLPRRAEIIDHLFPTEEQAIAFLKIGEKEVLAAKHDNIKLRQIMDSIDCILLAAQWYFVCNETMYVLMNQKEAVSKYIKDLKIFSRKYQSIANISYVSRDRLNSLNTIKNMTPRYRGKPEQVQDKIFIKCMWEMFKFLHPEQCPDMEKPLPVHRGPNDEEIYNDWENEKLEKLQTPFQRFCNGWLRVIHPDRTAPLSVDTFRLVDYQYLRGNEKLTSGVT